MNIQASKIWLLTCALMLISAGSIASDDRLSTDYDETLNQDGERIKIWRSERIKGSDPASVQGLVTQERASVGLNLEGNSLVSKEERFMQSDELQAFENQISNQTESLGALGSLITDLESGSIWEMMEPVVGNWTVTSTAGNGTWTPATYLANYNEAMLQEKDGSATKERMVEVYEKNRSTGEERMVNSYIQETTTYEFDRRSVIALENPQTGETPANNNDGWSEWKQVGEPYDFSEWWPKREAVWRGLPVTQVQWYTVDHEAYKWIYKFVSGNEQIFLGTYTKTSVSEDAVFGPDGTQVSSSTDGCTYFCYSGEKSSAPEGRLNVRETTGTKPLPANGCYYDDTPVASTDSQAYKHPGVKYEDEYGLTNKNTGNPRFVATTWYSTNQYVGGDHILNTFYFDGVEVHKDMTKPGMSGGGTGCIMLCGGIGGIGGSGSYGAIFDYEFFYGTNPEDHGPGAELVYPVTTARNGGPARNTNTNYTETNVVKTSDLPIRWNSGGKEFYLGAKMSETRDTVTSAYNGSTWTNIERTYQVCMRNR